MKQEVMQVAIRNGQQQRALEETRITSPLSYYDSEWRLGTVKLASGQELRTEMRYNLVARELELRCPGPPARPDSVLVLRQFQAVQLSAGQVAVYHDFVAHPYQSAQSNRDYNLFEKLTAAPGPVQLLLLHEVLTQTATAAFAPGGTGRPAQTSLERVSRLYVQTPKRTTVREIALNKAAILSLFGAEANRMASYAAAHTLSFTDLGHMVQLVDEYNKTAQP